MLYSPALVIENSENSQYIDISREVTTFLDADFDDSKETSKNRNTRQN